MLGKSEQAAENIEQARVMRAAGTGYRDIGRKLGLTSGQLSHVRRTLKREKAARTRLYKTAPHATERDLPVAQSALPPELRKTLVVAGYRTLGDIADRLADAEFRGLETMAGIGRHRAQLVKRLLDQFGLLPGSDDLRAEIERLFPEFGEPASGQQPPE